MVRIRRNGLFNHQRCLGILSFLFLRSFFLNIFFKKKKKCQLSDIFLCWLEVAPVSSSAWRNIKQGDSFSPALSLQLLELSWWHPHAQNCRFQFRFQTFLRERCRRSSQNAGDFGCSTGRSLCSTICLCNWKFQNVPEAIIPFPEGFFRDLSFQSEYAMVDCITAKYMSVKDHQNIHKSMVTE